MVKKGRAQQVPVEVPVNDGKLAKVIKIVTVGRKRLKQELTGEDEVVASNQAELTDGQPVSASPIEKRSD